MSEDGLFGPDSVTWRVHADPMMLVGGIRALLLQAVHPVAMAAVAQFSDYRTNPWGRLLRTAEFVAQTTYGTTETARAQGDRVRSVHDRLGGVDPMSGSTYKVSDPHLLRWVHVCEAESFLTTFRRAGGHLAPGDGDRYYTEMQRAAVLVGCFDVPATEADIASYLRDTRRELVVTRAAREAAFFIINPPMKRWISLSTPAKPAWWALGSLAFALLPRWARRLYAMPGLPTTDIGASVAARVLRASLLTIPAAAREGPSLRAAKARLVVGAGA